MAVDTTTPASGHAAPREFYFESLSPIRERHGKWGFQKSMASSNSTKVSHLNQSYPRGHNLDLENQIVSEEFSRMLRESFGQATPRRATVGGTVTATDSGLEQRPFSSRRQSSSDGLAGSAYLACDHRHTRSAIVGMGDRSRYYFGVISSRPPAISPLSSKVERSVGSEQWQRNARPSESCRGVRRDSCLLSLISIVRGGHCSLRTIYALLYHEHFTCGNLELTTHSILLLCRPTSR